MTAPPPTRPEGRYLPSVFDALSAICGALGRHPDEVGRRLPEWERQIRSRDGAVLGDAVDALLAEWTDHRHFPTPAQFGAHVGRAHAARFHSRPPMERADGRDVFCRFCGTTELFGAKGEREYIAHFTHCVAQHPSERALQEAAGVWPGPRLLSRGAS